MTPCARGCCFTGLQVCARKRACACHTDEHRPHRERASGHTHNDPTANEAIRRAMKGQK